MLSDWIQPPDQQGIALQSSKILWRASTLDTLNGTTELQLLDNFSTFNGDEAFRSSGPDSTGFAGAVYVYNFTGLLPPVDGNPPPGAVSVAEYESDQGEVVAGTVRLTARILTDNNSGVGGGVGSRPDAYALSRYGTAYDLVGSVVHPPGGDYFGSTPPPVDMLAHEGSALFTVTAAALAADPAAQFAINDLDVGVPDSNDRLLLALFPVAQSRPGFGVTSESSATLVEQVGGAQPQLTFTYRPPRVRWNVEDVGVLKVQTGVFDGWRKVGCEPTGVTGLLKLQGNDGITYREVAAGEDRTGCHPLKIEHPPGSWITVGCFVPDST